MKFRSVLWSLFLLLTFLVPGRIFADDEYSHVRIVRLSLVQGDVRFSRSAQNAETKGQNAAWESAAANLPIREGFVVATDKGRAVVEFENGASAYLAEDSVLEFSQLGLLNGALITHLKLTQGTATFYAQPGQSDEFIVESPTMSVSLGEKGSLRLDVAVDGGWVSVLSGHAQVISQAGTQQVEKDQMFVLRTGEATTSSIERVPPADDFDKWVAGREETATTATSVALQYANSPSYTAGFADLYTYGAWFPYQGMGSCWQPYGAGLGWMPFTSGLWMNDPAFGGWTWVSNEPWGWLPYHFGGWVYASNGWCWAPSGIGWGAFGSWRPMTAVWVRGSGRHRRGLVPLHPLDRPGRTPVNSAQGIIVPRVPGRTAAPGTAITRVNPGETLKVLRQPPRTFRHEEFVSTPAPPRASRTIAVGTANPRAVLGSASGAPAGAPSTSRPAGIVFDPRAHAYVNDNSAPAGATAGTSRPNLNGSGRTMPVSPSGPVTSSGTRRGAAVENSPGSTPSGNSASRPTRTQGSTTTPPSPAAPRTSSPPPSRSAPSTTAPRSSGSGGAGAGSSSGRSSGGGGGSSSGGGGRSSGGGGGGRSR